MSTPLLQSQTKSKQVFTNLYREIQKTGASSGYKNVIKKSFVSSNKNNQNSEAFQKLTNKKNYTLVFNDPCSVKKTTERSEDAITIINEIMVIIESVE